MLKPSIKSKLKGIVGEKYITDDPVELYCYSHDFPSRALSWLDDQYRFMADFVIKPQNAEQVKEIIDLANEESLKLIPRGAGTSLVGQCLPIEGGVILDFNSMNKIIEVNTEDNYTIVEPGVLFKDLGKKLRNTGRGYWIPCNPGSADVCTIGGMIANDASGESAIKYGTVRDYVLNLEIIFGTGQKVKLGRLVKKTVSGLDLLSLFIGSEGTLGVVTKATLQFLALPDSFITILGFFDSIKDVIHTAKEIKDYFTPMSLEIIDQLIINGMNSYLSRLTPKIELKVTPAALMVRLDGDDKIISSQANYISDLISKSEHSSDIKVLKGIEHEYIWRARDGAGPSLMRVLRPFRNARTFLPAVLDFTVPFSKINILMQKLDEIMKANNLACSRLGHLGDGNVHLIGNIELKSKENIKKLGDIQNELVNIANSLGGSLTAEHGCGIWKAPYLSLEHGEEAIEIMRKIKSMFDPNNILNPGKMYSTKEIAIFSNG
ncbi:MAG: FAD-binding oxidoreductase [Candidatus Thorarchaeota archaeon]